ncbi:MAG: type II and III secretion system protein family protein [Alphaproteobacteria bacterium]|nr:type II and III secretion system protein family protein [Alphaproteobacteria bacterium]
MKKLLTLLLLIAAATLTAPGPAAAKGVEILSTTDGMLDIERGKGRLLRLPAAANTVFLADPDKADLQIKSPRMIYVFGKTIGETTLYAVDAREQLVAAFDVRITPNVASLKEILAQAAPDSDVRIETVQDQIVLTGSLASPETAATVLALAQRSAGDGNVVNRMTLSGSTQVNLRVRVAEVSREVIKRFGINWESIFDDGSTVFGLATGTDIVDNAGTIVRPPESQNSILFGARDSNYDVNGIVDILEQEGLATVLAEPNLTAVSGQRAEFLAGGEFPVIVPQTDDLATVEFKPFGVSLAFTPVVMDGGRINLHVAPEVSELIESGSIEIEGFTIPALSTRRADTRVELASGQSFVIAGLLQRTVDHDIREIPGLGDIPLLGALFRSDAFQRGETELVIIVTPYLVKPVSDPSAIATPLDGFEPATDTDRYVHGRTYRGTLPKTFRRTAAAAGGLVGPAGFIVD